MKWFSSPFDTIEEAQANIGRIDFFASYGVFQQPDGKYVWADMRLQQWSKTEIATFSASVKRLTGLTLVSYTDALFGWQSFGSEAQS